MLESVHGNDDVRGFLGRRYEEAGILNTSLDRLLSCGLENLLPDIDADHPLGSSSSHLYGIRSFATAEVDDNFPGNPGEEFVPH